MALRYMPVPGYILHVILQIPVATGTVSQVIRGDVMVSGYYE